MKITSHKTITSTGNDKHHLITINWFNREWKIIINDNCIKKITTIHLWDNGQWRPFGGHDLNETIVYKAIKENKIIKLKYRIG